MAEELFVGRLIYGIYRLIQKIGEGAHGVIFSAINVIHEDKYALKFEKIDDHIELLKQEGLILAYLKSPGIPYVITYGVSNSWYVLVMELLGRSLENYLQNCNGKFSVKTTVMIAHQMIDRLEHIHNKHLIHRDIKPENFVFGLGENENTLYMIDFGLAEQYRSSKTHLQLPFKTEEGFTGTRTYSSIFAMLECRQSRKDDMESFGYILLYLLKGSLPWGRLEIEDEEEKWKQTLQMKLFLNVKESFKGFPSQFEEIFNYVRGLLYIEDPNYNYIRSLLNEIANEQNFKLDYQWDWKIKTTDKEKTFETKIK